LSPGNWPAATTRPGSARTWRCLFGNLDSELLLRNDPVEIAAAVREQIRQSGPDTPFIVSTGSPLVSNIEPSAVEAMLRAAREEGTQP
jgi:uroporphyrinogen-III decarboxylase